MPNPDEKPARYYGWRRSTTYRLAEPYLPRPVDTLPPRFIQPWSRPIQDQGNLGSCTGNGVERVIQNMRLKQGLTLQPYSRLQIYYDERVIENTVDSDAGAMIHDGIKVITTKGAVLESEWPYDVMQFATAPPAEAYRSVEVAVAARFIDNTDLDRMKNCLAVAQIPIVFGFSAFMAYETVDSSGLCPTPDGSENAIGGHCNVIEGYDDSVRCRYSNSPGAFWVANSWGATEWGDKGYCWLAYEYLCNPSFSSDHWAVELVKSVSN